MFTGSTSLGYQHNTLLSHSWQYCKFFSDMYLHHIIHNSMKDSHANNQFSVLICIINEMSIPVHISKTILSSLQIDF